MHPSLYIYYRKGCVYYSTTGVLQEPMNFEIQVSGNSVRITGALANKVATIGPFLRQVARYQERATKLNFAKQSDPDGVRWAPLAASTLRTKKSGAILRETSGLIGSVSSEIIGARAVVKAGQQYGAFHQTGTRKMPQRRFLGIGEQDRKQIIRLAENYFSP